jgi:Fur family ferric uptake transcriptional regulator
MPGMDVGHRLRDEGYRLTPQRRLVWEVLRSAEHHLTAEQIHDAVSQTAPDLNVASVYRTLTLLAELDLVKEVQLGDGRGHWELAHPDDAFHLVCRGCGQVTHHTGTVVEDVRTHLASQHGFAPEQVELIVRGLCAACQAAG